MVVDHSDGSLAFGVNSAPPRRVPEGWPTDYDPDDPPPGEPPAKVPFKFPQGAPLRPWATQSSPRTTDRTLALLSATSMSSEISSPLSRCERHVSCKCWWVGARVPSDTFELVKPLVSAR